MRIKMVPNRELDQELFYVQELQELWQQQQQSSTSRERHVDLDLAAVESIPLSSLELINYKKELISIVSIPTRHDRTTCFVFKIVQPARFASNRSETYHELKLLLSMPPHPHISARPLYLVTRTPTELEICGFILPYYHGGSLLDALSVQATIPFLDRVCWSRQIASALLHIHTRTPAKYHADLKPDNVMLTVAGADSDAVLIDFEQRGGWVSWIAPEVACIWYLSLKAKSTAIPSGVAGRYRGVLQRFRVAAAASSSSSSSSSFGDIAWTLLLPAERESAMVFALGKTLWCIFEQQPTIYTDAGKGTTREAATWIDDERSWRFPEFQRTPKVLWSWIERCTAGADEWDVLRGRSVHFDIYRGIFVPVGEAGATVQGDGELRTQQAAKTWWEIRVAEAEDFAEARVRGDDHNGIQAAARKRPRLQDILEKLKTDHPIT